MEAKSYLMEFDLETDRSAWCNAMRLEYSPKGMCNEDGSINQDFFRPAKVRLLTLPLLKQLWYLFIIIYPNNKYLTKHGCDLS